MTFLSIRSFILFFSDAGHKYKQRTFFYMLINAFQSMLTMDRSSIHLLDLPDEILLILFKKLDNVDVLHSLIGINHQRLDRLTREKTFSNFLSFTSTFANNTEAMDRFCIDIEPRIHLNVKRIVVEAAFMERIILAADYPYLTELKLSNFQRDTSLDYFTSMNMS